MLNGGTMVWGFCVHFVYMIPLETDVLRKHRFQKCIYEQRHEFPTMWYVHTRSLIRAFACCLNIL